MSKIDQNQNRVLTLRHISSKKRDKKKCFWRSIFFCLWHFLITARVDDDDDVQVEFEIICNDFLFSTWCWWQTVWLDLAKFRHFVQFLNAFFDFRRPKLLIGKIWKHICQKYAIGPIFIFLNGQISQNILAIWSHWWQPQKAKKYAAKDFQLIDAVVWITVRQVKGHEFEPSQFYDYIKWWWMLSQIKSPVDIWSDSSNI